MSNDYQTMPFTVDQLSNEIRRVDGKHELGAGALAEALMPFLAARFAEPWGIRDEETGYLRTFRSREMRDHFYGQCCDQLVKPVMFGPEAS